jgi:hypothetical protein
MEVPSLMAKMKIRRPERTHLLASKVKIMIASVLLRLVSCGDG